jgi:hypothetical protein
MGGHINDLDGNTDCLDDGMFEGFRFTDGSYYHPIMVCVRMNVKELHIIMSLKRQNDSFNVIPVPSFTEIGHSFNDLFHGISLVFVLFNPSIVPL